MRKSAEQDWLKYRRKVRHSTEVYRIGNKLGLNHLHLLAHVSVIAPDPTQLTRIIVYTSRATRGFGECNKPEGYVNSIRNALSIDKRPLVALGYSYSTDRRPSLV